MNRTEKKRLKELDQAYKYNLARMSEIEQEVVTDVLLLAEKEGKLPLIKLCIAKGLYNLDHPNGIYSKAYREIQ